MNFGDSQREVVESLEPATWDVLDMNLEDACILYLVDLSTRTVQTVFESPEMIASFSVPLEPPSTDAEQPSRGPIQVVRTSGHLHWLNRQHEVSRTFPFRRNRTASSPRPCMNSAMEKLSRNSTGGESAMTSETLIRESFTESLPTEHSQMQVGPIGRGLIRLPSSGR